MSNACLIKEDDKSLTPEQEVKWGWAYRVKKKTDRDNRKLPTKKVSLDKKCKIEKMMMRLKCPPKPKCKKHKKKKNPERKITLLERNTMNMTQYMNMLSRPRTIVKQKVFKEKCPKKLPCELGPCPPRIVMMSLPNRRILWETWKNYQDVLAPETIVRIDDMLHTEQNVEPKQASVYFKDIDKKKRKKRMQKILKRLRKERKKNKLKKQWVKKRVEQISKAILCYIRDAPYFDLNYKQYLFSEGILSKLKDAKQIPNKLDRNSKNCYKRSLIEISDKCAVWVDALMKFVENQYVESDSDIEEEVIQEPYETPLSSSVEEEEEEEEEAEEGESEWEEEEEAEDEEDMGEWGEEYGEDDFSWVPKEFDDILKELGEMGDDEVLDSEGRHDEGEDLYDQEVDEFGEDESPGEDGGRIPTIYEEPEDVQEDHGEDEGVSDESPTFEPVTEEGETDEEMMSDMGEGDEVIVISDDEVDDAEKAIEKEMKPLETGEEGDILEEGEEEPLTTRKKSLEGPEDEEGPAQDMEVLYEKCQIEGEIAAHKPPKVLEHQPGTICCLSLKIWSVWLLEITHNAHNWTKWMADTIRKVREFASIIRGEIKEEDGSVKVLYKYDWRQFCRETKSSIKKWSDYSKHVQNLNQQISDEFKGKRVTCCPKCLQDNIIKNVVTAHNTFKALTEAMNEAAYWHCNLEELVDQASLVSNLEETEVAAEPEEEISAGPSIIDFQEMIECICHQELPDDDSVYSIVEVLPEGYIEKDVKEIKHEKSKKGLKDKHKEKKEKKPKDKKGKKHSIGSAKKDSVQPGPSGLQQQPICTPYSQMGYPPQMGHWGYPQVGGQYPQMGYQQYPQMGYPQYPQYPQMGYYPQQMGYPQMPFQGIQQIQVKPKPGVQPESDEEEEKKPKKRPKKCPKKCGKKPKKS